MASAAGFGPIDFPHTLPMEELDVVDREESGDVVANFMSRQTLAARQVYAAHAVSYRLAVVQALEEGHEWVAIFEDDIILTAPPADASRRIQRALAQVPADADTIHMEYCFEACNDALFHPLIDTVSTAAQPFCSAAILVSRRGQQRLSTLLKPSFSAIDNMIAEFCMTERLNCYKLRSPVFAQDMYWGSSLARHATSALHRFDVDKALCREHNSAQRMIHYIPSRREFEGIAVQHPHLHEPRLSGRQERHSDLAPFPRFSAPEQHFPCTGGERGGRVGGLVLTVRVSDLMQHVVYSLRVTVTGKTLRVRAADNGTFWYRGKDEVLLVFAVSADEDKAESVNESAIQGGLEYRVTLEDDDVHHHLPPSAPPPPAASGGGGGGGSGDEETLQMELTLYDTYPGLAGNEGLLAVLRRDLVPSHSMPLCDLL